jgi:hypothetical protein
MLQRLCENNQAKNGKKESIEKIGWIGNKWLNLQL